VNLKLILKEAKVTLSMIGKILDQSNASKEINVLLMKFWASIRLVRSWLGIGRVTLFQKEILTHFEECGGCLECLIGDAQNNKTKFPTGN